LPTVVLGVTGCIGAYKACEVLRELQRHGVDVRVVMTEHATRFVSALTFETLSRHPVFVDQFSLGASSEIQHIGLADTAELLLVAPATANVIGKFARGIADDALTTLYMATKAPVIVAPAMNVQMFEHSAVVENLVILRSRGVGVVEPGSGYLACGWLGKGRLAEPGEIVRAALDVLKRRQDLARERVIVTAGPTVEDIDPVRFLSNRSTGRMGYRLAEAARDRGAEVVLISGPTCLTAPKGVEFVSVRTADEMSHALGEKVGGASIVAMAAAVSDYRPKTVTSEKIKKRDDAWSLSLVQTPDILRSLGDSKGKLFLVGFAAETHAVLENARTKRREKNLDLIVANVVGQDDRGFALEQNAATLIDDMGEIEVPLVTKRELADRIWNRVVELRHRS